MTKAEMKTLKMNILGGMDTYIRELGDEELMEPWLMCGVPDEATEDDLEYIAEDLDEFTSVCKLFGKLVRTEYKEFGDKME